MRTAVVLAALLALGCQTPPAAPATPGTLAPSGDVVMTVNGADLTQNMIDAVTVRIPTEQLERMQAQPGQMDRFYDQVALGQVLYEKAIADKLHEDPAVQAGLAMAAREFLAGIYVQRAGEAAITDAAVEKYYKDREVQFVRPQVQARHILVKEESLANDLFKQLKDGAEFETLAKEHSKDTGSAQRGGDLGWFEKGRMVEEFSDAAFGAEKGDIVGPVQTRFGFHVIQVTDKRDAQPLEEVRPQIVSALRQEAVETMLTEARSSLVVEKKGAAAEAEKAAKAKGGFGVGGADPHAAGGAPPHGEGGKPQGHP